MCVPIAQINLTIKEIFLSCQLLSTPQNSSPARTHSPIYQPHRTRALKVLVSKNPK